MLASAIVMGAEAPGKGLLIATPYIEHLGAIEVEFYMHRKSSGENVISPQALGSYYTKKWGGDPQTSHLLAVIKKTIWRDLARIRIFLPRYLQKLIKLVHLLTIPLNILQEGSI